MNFIVSGLPAEPFIPLYGLSAPELAERQARRVVVDGPGFPDRIEMRDAEPGETLLLVNYEHQTANSPFRSSHAIYVKEGATESVTTAGLPDVLRRRLLSLRGFSEDGMMIDADVVEGAEAESLIERMFGDQRISYLHAHSARPGCYLGRIDRA